MNRTFEIFYGGKAFPCAKPLSVFGAPLLVKAAQTPAMQPRSEVQKEIKR
jgi:hypothetical protein